MSHNLYQTQGRYAMWCRGNRHAAWHELGQRTPDAQSWQDAMRLAGLDWEVRKAVLFNADHRPVEAWGIFRNSDGAFLGAVGAQYEPIQNAYAFDFVDSLLEAENGAHYESAGALGKGERIWCLARVPHDITIQGTDDKSESYLLFTTSHDGSIAATAKLTTVRVVCQNTLTQALSTTSGAFVRVKHTREAERRLERAKQLMSGVAQDVKTLEEKLNILAQRRMTRESMTSVLDRLFPKPTDGKESTRRDNVLSEVLRCYESNDQNAIPQIRGTAYNLLNAVTEYTDHLRGARITAQRAGYTESQARAENALFGTGEKLKAEALEVILESTNGAPMRQVITSRPPTAGGLLDSVLDATP